MRTGIKNQNIISRSKKITLLKKVLHPVFTPEKKENADLVKKLEVSNAELDCQRVKQQEILTSQADDRSKLESELVAIHEKTQKLDELISSKSSLESEVVALKDEIAQKSSQNLELLENISNLKSLIETVEKNKKEKVDSLESDIEQLVQELADKNSGLEKAKEMFFDYQESMKEVKETAETVKAEKEILEGEKVALSAKIRELEAKHKESPPQFKTPSVSV